MNNAIALAALLAVSTSACDGYTPAQRADIEMRHYWNRVDDAGADLKASERAACFEKGAMGTGLGQQTNVILACYNTVRAIRTEAAASVPKPRPRP